MQYKWLIKNDHKSVVVIFSGWAFDSEIYSHLLHSDDLYDVICVFDYRDLDTQLPSFDAYHAKYLLAWSFGVASFSDWNKLQLERGHEILFDQKVAVNGTMQAVDRFLGIPEKVMQKTINTLSEQSFRVFTLRCFQKDFIPDNLKIDVEDRKAELQAILDREHSLEEVWDAVWISSNDKIFPTKNSLLAWEQYNQSRDHAAMIYQCDAPHAPFHLWSGLSEIFKI